jgi:hypothetical protein
MEYTFSWGWFFFGFILLLAGGAFTIWHQKIADAIGGGLGSYERYQQNKTKEKPSPAKSIFNITSIRLFFRF